MSKIDLIHAKQEFERALEHLDDCLTCEENRSIVIRDNEWVESAGSIMESFRPRFNLFLTKVRKIIERYPRQRRVRNIKKSS